MKRLVFATNNNHKLEEARAILGKEVELISLAELGCHEDIPETQPTIAGNALQKAHYIHDRYGVACVADDTGLMVDALDGAPGVYSARYAGPGHDSAANMAKLLKEMDGVTDRAAHFSTVLAYVSDNDERTFEGRVEGSIATEPSGHDGFGYDPVFIAAETGRTFADMTPEAKNAISHRGRAFRLFEQWFKTLVLAILLLGGITSADAEQWRRQPSYDGVTDRIIDTPDHTYFLTLKQIYDVSKYDANRKFGQLYRYDKKNDEWQWLSPETGLSEEIVVNAEYDYAHRLLVIAYDNGNIDLLSDNGEKVNVPGLKIADNASKDIQSITLDPATGHAWICTASGYVRIDPAAGEVVTSRDYGRSINAVAKSDGHLFVGTESGLCYGDERSSDLESFAEVPGVEKVSRMFITADGRLWVVYGDQLKWSLGEVVADGEGYSFRPSGETNLQSAEPGRDGFVTSNGSQLTWHSGKGATTVIPRPSLSGATGRVGSMDGKTFWVSGGRFGFTRLNLRSDNTWEVTMQYHYPNASHAFMCVAMAHSPEYGMLVRNHGTEQEFTINGQRVPDLISSIRDGQWTSRSITAMGTDPGNIFTVQQPMGVAIDPSNPAHVYCGSVLHGILRLDLEDWSRSLHLNRDNGWGAGKKGHVTVVTHPEAWIESCNFATPSFDNSRTLWTSYYDPDTEHSTLWFWPEADRLASTDAASYRPMGKIAVGDFKASGKQMVLPLRSQGNGNIVVFHAGSYSNCILVLNHAGTPGVTGDDTRGTITGLTDTDGATFTIGSATSLWEDTDTGLVWVTSSQGVYTFNPREVLQGQTAVRRIKVPRNDGTNLADYLLDGAYVTMLTTDPAGNKWFGTMGAGIVITSADGRTIIKTYTTDNSELPDDNIHGMCYNPDNNSMMISTEKGLVELFLTSTDSSGKSKVRAYPNPVRPEFLGNVTIDGLPEQAIVKITDSHNAMIKDLGESWGGAIEWNLTDNNNMRVPPGIYYVHAGNGHDRDSFYRVARLLVVE